MKKAETRLARILAKELTSQNIELGHTTLLNIASRLLGEPSYQHLRSKTQPKENVSKESFSTNPALRRCVTRILEDDIFQDPSHWADYIAGKMEADGGDSPQGALVDYLDLENRAEESREGILKELGFDPRNQEDTEAENAVPRKIHKFVAQATILSCESLEPKSRRKLLEVLAEEANAVSVKLLKSEILPAHRAGDELEEVCDNRDWFGDEVPCTQFGEVFLRAGRLARVLLRSVEPQEMVEPHSGNALRR